MCTSLTKRKIIHSAGIGLVGSLAGCFGDAQSDQADEGEIRLITEQNNRDQDWARGETLRIVAQSNGEIKIDRSFKLPIDGLNLTIEPNTYEMSFYIGEEKVETYNWEVTECKSQLLLDFRSEESDGIHIGTSNC